MERRPERLTTKAPTSRSDLVPRTSRTFAQNSPMPVRGPTSGVASRATLNGALSGMVLVAWCSQRLVEPNRRRRPAQAQAATLAAVSSIPACAGQPAPERG